MDIDGGYAEDVLWVLSPYLENSAALAGALRPQHHSRAQGESST